MIMFGVLAIALIVLGAALRWRSWPLWLGAFGVTIVALWVTWYFRPPARDADDIVSFAIGCMDRGHILHASGFLLAERYPA